MDLRKSPRFSVGIRVAFWGDVSEGQGMIRNISMGGCAIESEVTPNTATYLKLSLLLPNVRSSLIVDLAPVRWSSYGHFGVEFIRMENDAQMVLRSFVGGLHAGAVEPGS